MRISAAHCRDQTTTQGATTYRTRRRSTLYLASARCADGRVILFEPPSYLRTCANDPYYDEAGNVIQIANPDNYTLGFQYDEANHLIQAFDQENHTVTRTLDLEGKPRTITDPNGNSIGYAYYDSTGDGRLKTVTDALNHSTTFAYDANGNATGVTDNLGRVTLSQYDELNRPTRIVGPQYTDATLGAIRPVTQYVYDTLSRRIQVKAGYTTDTTGQSSAADVLATQLTSAFDDFGRKVKETDQLAKFSSFEYDANNNLVKSTDAKNQLTQYTWGYGHQLLAVHDQNNNTYAYTRNSLGQVTVAQSPAVSYSYQYDASHRLATFNDARGNKTLSYAYSPGGLLNFMQDSDGNRTDYLYDPVGRLTGIWAPNYDYVSFSYDNGGRLTEKWFPNGVDAQFAWNKDNTLASLTNKAGSTTISSHVYAYDGVGNRSTQTETVNGSGIAYGYQYDNLNRLIQVQNGNVTQQENYAYDPLGNRTAKTVNATTPSTVAYVYDQANQLKEIHQTNVAGTLLGAMVYDPNGSLTAKCEGTVTTNGTTCTGTTVTSLTYDALNRLTQASKTGQSNQTYAYDDSGRRIAKTIATTTTNFLYGGPDIVAEYAATWGLPTAQYTHGPNQDEPIERITATAAQYFHHDGLGSVVGVTNNLGGTDATQRFDAWGNKVASTGTGPRYGYTGREPDETGLTFYRARYYDPSIGRFTQRDPIGLAGGINQYAYVNGNPINRTDPSGERPPTEGEVAFLQTVYNNKVDYGKIDIQSGASLDPRTWGPVATGAAVTLENTVHFPSSGYQNDFSKADLSSKQWLVHEVGHVYQYQNNRDYSWVKAAAEGVRSDTYKYQLDFSKSLTDYRFEQQATLLADYYRALVRDSSTKTEFESVLGPSGLGDTVQNSLCCPTNPSLSETTTLSAPAAPYSGSATTGYNPRAVK